MLNLSGYQANEIIYESTTSIVYRGRRNNDNLPVVIKLLKGDYPTPDDISRYRHEFAVLNKLHASHIIEVMALEDYGKGCGLILEDFGGESLNKIFFGRRFDTSEFFDLAIEIVKALVQIHGANVIHKDINPSNIVVNQETGQLKIIDFGISSELSYESKGLDLAGLEGTLVYISPEQTGRMNRILDYRTDFYSLGVTFYELLCHRLPFISNNSLELVHFHIARNPVPPNRLNSDIPLQLSYIIMKLLAKNADGRYQNAHGLLYDLELCAKQWEEKGKISIFALAEHDISDRFSVGQKIYGRKQELDTLSRVFAKVLNGSREVVMVSGAVGQGKTSLIMEAAKEIQLQGGRYAVGRFEQYKMDVPYKALIEAFNDLVKQILSESDAELSLWRERIKQRLGSNAALVADVIPALEQIIGPQEAVCELSPLESHNRFVLVFSKLVGVFCRSDQPLIFFLDDLQWACAASCQFLQQIMNDDALENFMLIVAVRDKKVGNDHPVQRCFDFWRQQKVSVTRLSLRNLDTVQVGRMLVDTLMPTTLDIQKLAEIVKQKTVGNPFFIGMFLHTMHKEKQLWVDVEKGNWLWDVELVKEADSTENVEKLLAAKINGLSIETQNVLKHAAVLGTEINLFPLALLLDKTIPATVSALQEAVAEGLVVPSGSTYRQVSSMMSGGDGSERISYSFVHDRLQKAAYSMLDESHKLAAHKRYGIYLKRTLSEAGKQERIFDIVKHLNIASVGIIDPMLRHELAELNLQAAKKAMSSAAWQVSRKHLLCGIELLGDAGWQQAYNLTLELHVKGAETSYLCGEYDTMECLTGMVLEQAHSLMDKVRAYEVMIQAYKAQYKIQKAIDVALPVLNMLGHSFSQNPSRLQIMLTLQRTKLALSGKDLDSISQMEDLNNPEVYAAIRVINSVGSAAYFIAPNLTPVLVFTAIRLIVKNGMIPEGSFFCAVYGMICCGFLDDINTGCRFGKLALDILERYETSDQYAKTIHMVYGFVMPYKKHLRDSLPPLLDGHNCGLESGDNEYAGYCCVFYCYYAFNAGLPLADVFFEMCHYRVIINKLGHDTAIYTHGVFTQALAVVHGDQKYEKELVGKFYDEKISSILHVKAHDQLTLFCLYYNKLYLQYIFGDNAYALQSANLARKYIDGVIGQAIVPLFYFYDSLACLASQDVSAIDKEIFKRVTANQRKLESFAEHAPMNYRHKFQLVEAEINRLQGNTVRAGELYDLAISKAKENEYLNDEALCGELAGAFYLSCNRNKIARAYLLEARHLYLCWGAVAKAAHLDKIYPVMTGGAFAGIEASSGKFDMPVGTTVHGSGSGLDIATIVKASQAISSEIVLENLMQRLLRIVIENAGAEYGALVKVNDGRLRVEAEGWSDHDKAVVLRSTPLEECSVSPAVINYVYRTGESIMLADAASEGRFASDGHIAAHKTKSVLCVPVKHKAEIIAIIYLENNLVAGAFTPERLQLLTVLCSQIAISLENASLFINLEESETRYRELFENIIDMVVLIDFEGRIVMANPLFFTSLEREPHIDSGMTLCDWVHADDLSMVEEKMLSELAANEIIKDLQFRVVGSAVEYEVSCNAKCIRKAGKLVGFQMVVRDVTKRNRLEKELVDSLRDAQNARIGTILGLAKLAEYRDEDTGSHLERIREYARMLTRELAKKPDYKNYITPQYIEDIYLSSILHDIGKVGVPDSILLKPGRLTSDEFEKIKLHSIYGGDALAAVEKETQGQSFLALGKTIAYHHHEKWDGSGYPDGLAAEKIPLSTRIVGLVDVYDALTSRRCYKEAMSHEEAKSLIVKGKGSHFAPDIVDVFLANDTKFQFIRSDLLQ